MGNLSSVTFDSSTFPVFAGGGGSDMPIHVTLPKSASNSADSGLAMLAWPNGMRYVYCTVSPGTSADTTGYISPEYMGNGPVYISDQVGRGNSALYEITVIGDSTSGAVVTFKYILGYPPSKTSILFFVNPN